MYPHQVLQTPCLRRWMRWSFHRLLAALPAVRQATKRYRLFLGGTNFPLPSCGILSGLLTLSSPPSPLWSPSRKQMRCPFLRWTPLWPRRLVPLFRLVCRAAGRDRQRLQNPTAACHRPLVGLG